MSHQQRLRITVDLEDGTDPLRGTLETPDSQPRPFWGWLQLIQAIEDAITPGSQRADAQPVASADDTQTDRTPQEESDEHQGPQTDRSRDR